MAAMRKTHLRLLNTCLDGHRGDEIAKLADKLLGQLVDTLLDVSRQRASFAKDAAAWQRECYQLSAKLASSVRGITIDETGRVLPKQPPQQQGHGHGPDGIAKG